MSELKVGDRVVLKRNVYHAFENDAFTPGNTGEVVKIIDFDTHKVFVTDVYAATDQGEGNPWTFFDYELEILL